MLPPQLIRHAPPCQCATHVIKLRALVQRNGLRQHAIYCLTTNYRGSFIPLRIVTAYAAAYGCEVTDIPVYRDNRSGCCDGSGCPDCGYEPCGRCGSYKQVQYHHWAPHYLFDDADLWPGSNLCAPCHRKWHATVTPRMHERLAG